MNKSMLVGAVLGAVGVTAGGAVATYSLVDRGPDYAEVLAVTPINETVKTPREVCQDVTVTRQRPVQDQHQIAGTAIGAIAGGLLGNQVGVARARRLRPSRVRLAAVMPATRFRKACSSVTPTPPPKPAATP